MGDIEVPQPGASEIVGRLLSEALREHPDVQWLGLMSEDGFAIASDGVGGVDDDAVAAGSVRMMVQVRNMAKALGQSGTSQLFLEGSESGICVIDKDPWVLVMVGAPGVPIGLLRYEAREIAEAFPMGQQPSLTGPEQQSKADVLADDQQWWAADEAETPTDVPGAAIDEPEAEIRWADEPTSDEPAGPAEPQEPATDFVDWSSETFDAGEGEPAAETVFDAAAYDLAPAQTPAAAFDAAPGDSAAFDLAPAEDSVAAFDATPGDSAAFDLAPPSVDPAAVAPGFGLEDAAVPQFADLAEPGFADLAPPSGPAIDLPPPAGPAFELPPPE